MSRPLTLLALTCTMLAGAATRGQEPTARPDPPAYPNPTAASRYVADDPARRAAMAEDVEVMRRLLQTAIFDRSGAASPHAPVEFASPDGQRLTTREGIVLRLWDANTGRAATSFHGRADPTADPHATAQPEGVYLKGQGVVYTVTIPYHFREQVRPSVGTPGKALSPWDRVRRELHGEKPEPADKGAERHRETVADAILRVLAENGRHFSHLDGNEQITVAVTLRADACTSCHAGVQPPTRGQPPGVRGTPLFGPRPMGGGGGTGFAPPGATGAGPDTPAAPETVQVEAQNFARLGEMRLKQGRAQEAADALLKASAYYHRLIERGTAEATDRAAATDIDTRLAQAYVQLGDAERAVAFLRRVAGGKGGTGPDQPGAASRQRLAAQLPAKLVIAAPKHLLDRVGAGRMSLDDFRKLATVDYWDPSAAKAPSAGGGASTP